MERRGLQKVNINIDQNGVKINSEFTNPDYFNPKKILKETFPSLNDAKTKINSDFKMYQKFLYRYGVSTFAELGVLLASVVKSANDVIVNHDSAYGEDLLFLGGIAVILVATSAAEEISLVNRTKTYNKLAALKDAERLRLETFQDEYPF